MNSGSEYIKEIESYFLTLAGEGIMLSSFDYGLIQDWKKRNVPKDVVLKGIGRAFAGRSEGGKNGLTSPRTLRHCALHVEKCIEEYRPLSRGSGLGLDKSAEPGGRDGDAAERLERLIHQEKNASLWEYYIQLRKNVIRLDKLAGDYIPLVLGLEAEALEGFFNGLPEKEREKIRLEAEKVIKERARFMTKSAYDESLASFRNEILVRKYGIKCIIS